MTTKTISLGKQSKQTDALANLLAEVLSQHKDITAIATTGNNGAYRTVKMKIDG